MNILQAVQAVRDMTSSLNGMDSSRLRSIMSETLGFAGSMNNMSQLDQNVHIDAHFPNVREHTEIEKAFNNLVNMASMRASNYRD